MNRYQAGLSRPKTTCLGEFSDKSEIQLLFDYNEEESFCFDVLVVQSIKINKTPIGVMKVQS